MKVLSILSILIALQFLLTEGTRVARIKKGSNVYVKVVVANSKQLIGMMKILNKKLDKVIKNAGSLACPGGRYTCRKTPKNCAEVLRCGGRKSGVYTIKPDSKGAFKVYCDQKTDGGGWTVFQRRKDGSVDFYRKWNEYKNGFGNLKGEFWLGLEKIYRLTHHVRNHFRVELTDTSGNSAYAEYNYFALSSGRSKYSLSLGTYRGNAGDSLSYHRGMAFSAKDRDNDRYRGGNCAVSWKGAWWYNNCFNSNLNGPYVHGKTTRDWYGVIWQHWKGHKYSLKGTEMKIRPT